MVCKKTKNQTRQEFVLNVVKAYGFSASNQSWSRLFLMLKNCLLEATQVLLVIWAISLLIFLSINYPPLNQLQRACSLKFYFNKNCNFSLFICHVRKTREHFQQKFKVCRLSLQNLKKSRNYALHKIFVYKAVPFKVACVVDIKLFFRGLILL